MDPKKITPSTTDSVYKKKKPNNIIVLNALVLKIIDRSHY